MPFTHLENIKYFTSDLLSERYISHGFLTRQGGVSPEPWFSLNFGGTVGDDPNRVRVNHDIAFSELHLSITAIYDVWQVHGTDVAVAESPRILYQQHLKADIILTNKPGIVLFMRFADCVPIIIFDPIKRVIGLVHAGWKGTVYKAAGVAINSMIDLFKSNPVDVLAVIGPSIGPDHYVVGSNVISDVRNAFGDQSKDLLLNVNGSHHLDLWNANRLILEEAGVENIEMVELCTACNPDDWYSHRAENGKTGRFGAFIRLDQG